jgi:hypothetical protein
MDRLGLFPLEEDGGMIATRRQIWDHPLIRTLDLPPHLG